MWGTYTQTCFAEMEFSLDLQRKFSVIKVHFPSTLLTRTNTLYGVLILCLFWYSIKLYSLKVKYKSLHLLRGCKACILIQKSGVFCFKFFNVWCLKKKTNKPHTRGSASIVLHLKEEYLFLLKILLYEKSWFDKFSTTCCPCFEVWNSKTHQHKRHSGMCSSER